MTVGDRAAQELVSKRMAELTERFVSRSHEDLARIRAGVTEAMRGDGGALQKVREVAHRIRGTGGTLGLHSLGDAAAVLEKCIDAQIKTSVPAIGDVKAAVELLAAELTRLQQC